MMDLSDPKVKRAWLRKEAPKHLAILIDHILSPFLAWPPLGSFHREQCRLLDLDLSFQRNTVNVWSRGLFKTATITVGQTVQRILRDPEVCILIRHFDEDIAKSFLTGGTTPGIVDHFTKNPFMRYVFPEFCPRPGEKCATASSFTVPSRARKFRGSTRPSVTVAGLNSTVTGMHFDHIHDDDVETEKSVGRGVGDAVRDKHFSKWLDWTQLAERPTRNQRRGTYSCVGTFWHYDGILKRAQARAREFGFQFRIHAAWQPKTNTLLCPDAYPQQTLDRDRASLDPYEFNCAILCEPIDEERASFQVTDDLWVTTAPEATERSRRYMAVDPAYTAKRTSDYTGIVVVDVLPSDVWVVVACYAVRYEPLSLINELFELNRRWKPDMIYIEAVAAGAVIAKWALEKQEELGERLPLIEVKRGGGRVGTKEKQLRIQRLSPRCEAGRLKLHRQGPGVHDLAAEMRQWPLGKDDHLLDSLATVEENAPRGSPIRPQPPAPFLPGTVGWMIKQVEMEERRKVHDLVTRQRRIYGGV